MWFLIACSTPGPSETPPDSAPAPADTAPDTPPDTTPDSAAPDTSGDSAPDSGDGDSAGDTAVDTGDPITAGPCVTYTSATVVGYVQDTALDELSGLAASRLNPGILWTHEDSGNAADLYALDTTGATVATLHLEGVTNVDWEDLALGPCPSAPDTSCLFVGDIGDIGTDRADFALLVVEEPLLDGSVELSATPEVRPFTYPDTPEDAEALVVTAAGEPLVITKRTNATAGLYHLPAGASVLAPVAELSTGAYGEDLTARVTAADLWHDPPRLLVRTYLHLYEFDVADLAAPVGPTPVAFAFELQGEAVAYDPIQGGFWQVSEGVGPALHYTGCVE